MLFSRTRVDHMPKVSGVGLHMHRLRRDEAYLKEIELQAMVLDYLNIIPGCLAVEYFNGGKYHPDAGRFLQNNRHRPKGMPDIVGVINGRPFGIELKVGKGKTSKEQPLIHRKMRSVGWPVSICRSFNEAREFIQGIVLTKI